MDLALDNLQWLICHKTKPNQLLNNRLKHFTFSAIFQPGTWKGRLNVLSFKNNASKFTRIASHYNI